jgi:bifunctional non-homologous end joining protein LigD
VEVEDHPLDYGDFEGTIPKGQYGGGTVMLWDRGFWVPEDGKSAEQSLRDGELKFLLAGEKMQGGWVLVRMKRDRDGGSRNNWLLIKHKDEGAHPGDKDKLLDNDHSVASGRSMEEIAAGKGRGPTPFMLARRKVKPNAIWNSNKSEGGAASALSSTSKTRTKARPRQRSGKAASGGGKASSISEGNVVLGIKISNPDKELWPASADGAAVTKIELARYIADVGPWMIDHVKGRPCSVIRAPDGIDGQQFFQRHAGPGTPDVVEEVHVSGDRKAYIQIDTVEGLVAMAQMAALEFHPWNSAPGNPSMPGRLVFDLDPGPDVPFSMTVKAAKELRTRLDDLGLVSFCKTTGGKGLHVVTPLKTGRSDEVDWDRAKMFAQTVCAQMAHDEPGLYVTNMAKKLRTGRIFLDYLRNDSTATAVAPLSPRARPGATVSMPLTWAQVREDLDPKRFTIRTVPALLGRTSAWKDYSSSARSLKAAIKRLVGKG